MFILVKLMERNNMKYKISYIHTHNGLSQTLEFEIESELDLIAAENQRVVLEQALLDSRRFVGSGIGSVSVASTVAI